MTEHRPPAPPADAGVGSTVPESSGPLAAHAARGVAWVAGGRLFSQALQFASTIILARLLLPADYGLIAIVWVFTGFAFVLADLGIGPALVQARTMTEEAASTAFWINAVSGVVLTVIVVVLAHPLAALYGQPDLAPLLMVSAIGFTIALNVVPVAVLERQMRFVPLAVIDIAAATTGLAVSVICAAAGLGAVSLIIGPLVQNGLTSVIGFVVTGWRPTRRPTRADARRLIGFGGHLTGFNLLNYWARTADSLFLGKVASPASLGFYNRAYSLMLLPINQVGGVLGRVLLPVLARLQQEPERMVRAYLRVCRASGLLTFPLLLGLAAVAHNFALVLFGDRWTPMAPILIALALSGPPQIVSVTSGIVSQAVGRTKLLSTWGNLSSISVVVAILIGLPWGALGVAIAYAVRAWVLLPLTLMPATRAIDVTTRQVLRVSLLPFMAAAVMAAAVVVAGALLAPVLSQGLVLVLQVLLGVLVYVAAVSAVDRRALLDIVSLVRGRQLDA